MGNDISNAIIPPSLLFQNCLINGQIDIVRYIYYKRKLDHRLELIDARSGRSYKKRKLHNDNMSIVRKDKIQRSVQRHKILVRDSDGQLREILPTDTLWYLLYVATPPNYKRLLNKF